MAVQNTYLVPQPFQDIELKDKFAPPSYPFKFFITGIYDDDRALSGKINKLSFIYENPHTRVLVPIMGLGTTIKLDSVSKNAAWLELFFDDKRTPIFGVVRTGKSSQESNKAPWSYISSISSNSNVDMIKGSELSSAINAVTTIKEEMLALYNQLQKDIKDGTYNGLHSQTEEVTLLSEAEKEYNKLVSLANKYKESLPKLFLGCPTLTAPQSNSQSQSKPSTENIWRKVFRSFVPIVKILTSPNFTRNGRSFTFYPDKKPSETIQISEQINCNIVLADSLYDNTYPIKVALPCGTDTSIYALNDNPS